MLFLCLLKTGYYSLHTPCECLRCALSFGAEVSAFVPAQSYGGGRELLAEQVVLSTDAVADALHALVAAMLLAVAEGEVDRCCCGDMLRC